MEERKVWLDQPLEARLVEPNRALGQAITSMHNDWQTLTRFLSLPGAPLENNLVERALKLCIRQRQNSLFYRSEPRASIASVLTSVIVTGISAGGNVVDYCGALPEHRAEVVADPEAWWPWTSCTSRTSP